jgi:hypothetical protein
MAFSFGELVVILAVGSWAFGAPARSRRPDRFFAPLLRAAAAGASPWSY